jgi:hypothetical protein
MNEFLLLENQKEKHMNQYNTQKMIVGKIVLQSEKTGIVNVGSRMHLDDTCTTILTDPSLEPSMRVHEKNDTKYFSRERS